MYQFTAKFQYGGTTIFPGVVLKGNLVETDATVSLFGSDTFKDIPKSILEPYTPPILAKKTRKKVK